MEKTCINLTCSCFLHKRHKSSGNVSFCFMGWEMSLPLLAWIIADLHSGPSSCSYFVCPGQEASGNMSCCVGRASPLTDGHTGTQHVKHHAGLITSSNFTVCTPSFYLHTAQSRSRFAKGGESDKKQAAHFPALHLCSSACCLTMSQLANSLAILYNSNSCFPC